MSMQTMLESAGLSPEQAARRILELEQAYAPPPVHPGQLVAAADQRLPGVVIAPTVPQPSFKAAPLESCIKQRDTVPRRDPAKKKAQRKAARAARKRQRR